MICPHYLLLCSDTDCIMYDDCYEGWIDDELYESYQTVEV